MFSYKCGKINSEHQMERFINNWSFFLELPEAPSHAAFLNSTFVIYFVIYFVIHAYVTRWQCQFM